MISENEPFDNVGKWGDSIYEKLPSPNLEPLRDYGYELIFVIVLLTVVIIGGRIGGVIFVIRKKRK